ncbi:MAG: SlyX family protein [Alphaproteobacteria bacterium]|nr:SlyX family protein [Alphaproteobacteria bacterium]
MKDEELQTRLINIEMALDNQQKAIDDLSDVVIKQGKFLDYLLKQSEALKSAIEQDLVKPQSEETPPPHY